MPPRRLFADERRRVNLALLVDVSDKLDKLAIAGRSSITGVITALILEEYARRFPAPKLTPGAAQKQAQADARVVMWSGDERSIDHGGRMYVFHAGDDGQVAWGPYRGQKPDEAQRRPVTALALRQWREQAGEPPHDAREIPTVYDMEVGALKPKDPADVAEYERRRRARETP